MIKWAAHDDVADVPLCGLLSLCPSLPLRHFPLTHVTIRHPEALGNGFFSISLLTRSSTGFSRSNTVSAYTHIFPSSSHVRHIFLSLLGLSFYNHTLRYAPPSRFFIYSILEAAIDTRFTFLHPVCRGNWEENQCDSRSCSRVCTPALGWQPAPAASPNPPGRHVATTTKSRSNIVPVARACTSDPQVGPMKAEVELPKRHLFRSLTGWYIEFDVANAQAISPITNMQTGDTVPPSLKN